MSKKTREPKVVLKTNRLATSVFYGDRCLGYVFVRPGGHVWVSMGQQSFHWDMKAGVPFQNRNEGIAFILDRARIT